MNVVILESHKRELWEEFVNRSSSVIAWHSYGYSDLLKQHYGLKFFPLAVLEESRVRGILPLYMVDRFRTGRILMSVPYFVAGGIAAETEAARRALLERAIELGGELKADSIVLRQYKTRIEGPLITDETYYNRELTLTRDRDVLWNGFDETNKQKIRAAEEFQNVLEYPSNDVDGFYSLLMHDQHALGIPCVSRKWVERLQDTAMYKIALLRQNGKIVAGTMAKMFKDTVSFPFTALSSHGELGELMAYDLYWKLISYFADSGLRIFHSGRIPRGEQVPAYRLGWGGDRCNYYYQQYQKGESGTRGSGSNVPSNRGKKRDLFQQMWRKLPTSIAQAISPSIVRQFP